MSSFKKDDIVRDRYDHNYKGKVIEVVDEDELTIEWDQDPGRMDHVDPQEIRLYDPAADKILADKVQLKIDAAATSLEQAFKEWEEAQELYGDEPDVMASDKMIDIRGFERALERRGWSTSSLYC